MSENSNKMTVKIYIVDTYSLHKLLFDTIHKRNEHYFAIRRR
jgi:hypothetical protein